MAHFNLRVLVVDDSLSALRDMKTKLSEFVPVGQILMAQNYAQAVKIIKSQDLDIAFVDLQMPVKTGMDLILDVIYNDPKTKNLPVVVTTGVKENSLITDSLKAHTYRYLFKPISSEEIHEALSNIPPHENT